MMEAAFAKYGEAIDAMHSDALLWGSGAVRIENTPEGISWERLRTPVDLEARFMAEVKRLEARHGPSAGPSAGRLAGRPFADAMARPVAPEAWECERCGTMAGGAARGKMPTDWRLVGEIGERGSVMWGPCHRP